MFEHVNVKNYIASYITVKLNTISSIVYEPPLTLAMGGRNQKETFDQ